MGSGVALIGSTVILTLNFRVKVKKKKRGREKDEEEIKQAFLL